MSEIAHDDETWTIALGDRTFAVPRLPFRVSRVVYPICQRLTNADLPARVLGRDGEPLQLTDAEVDDLARIAFLAGQAADPSLTQEAFDGMPIIPAQLYGAFFAIRMACGGWARVSPASSDDGEGQEDPGEARGDAATSPTLTSTRSSRG